MSLGQNVDMLLFDKKARLANEFNRLFRSLFANYEEYKNIVLLLSKKRMGCSRTEIAQSLGRTSGGALTIKGENGDKGTQIDLVIIRKDNVVNLCEMKFTNQPYVIDKEYHEVLLHRIEILRNYLKDDNKSIHLTFITSKGVKPNMYSGIIQNEVTLDELF